MYDVDEKKSITMNWNENAQSLNVAWFSKTLFSDLHLAVEIDGKWLEPDQWETTSKDFLRASINDVELQLYYKPASSSQPYHWLCGRIVNRSSRCVHLGSFRFYQICSLEQDEFLSTPGSRLRLYREGWTAVAAAGTVRYGEKDYDLDPNYLSFAVSSPTNYNSKCPNHFSAEYVTVLNDRETNQSLLTGFISSADQVTRIAVEMDVDGVSCFEAFSYGDDILVEPGESISSEELVIMAGEDGYGLLEKYADLWGRRMKTLRWDHTPTGWCSWYYYFDKISEADVLENLQSLEDAKPSWPLEYIQIDDGYQSALGDWLECNSQFPHGLKFLAEKIKSTRHRPGLWLAPFMVEERSKLYAEHPDWMIKDKKNETVWATTWRGSRVAVLDCTRPESQSWLRMIFSTLASLGYEYVKLDFLMYECSAMGGVYYDPKATRAQACRKGLQAIRDGFGDRFILGGTTVLGPAVGLVNGERIGTDITPYWKPDRYPLPKEAPCVPNVCRNIINRRYMHKKLWLNDPDVHIARIDNNQLTEDEVILWTSALWLVGGLTLISDRFSTLSPHREKLSRMLLKSLDKYYARPLDFFESEYPSIWIGRRQNRTTSHGDLVLGMFNFCDTNKLCCVDLRQADIPSGKVFDVHDFWAERSLGKISDSIAMKLYPHNCKLLMLTPAMAYSCVENVKK